LLATTFDTINTDTGIFDTPDSCVERIRQIDREFGPGRMICWFNFFGAIPHQRVLDSIELFSAKVLPPCRYRSSWTTSPVTDRYLGASLR
jgi:hypothetical protein